MKYLVDKEVLAAALHGYIELSFGAQKPFSKGRDCADKSYVNRGLRRTSGEMKPNPARETKIVSFCHKSSGSHSSNQAIAAAPYPLWS